jgi:hypothetical protein
MNIGTRCFHARLIATVAVAGKVSPGASMWTGASPLVKFPTPWHGHNQQLELARASAV